MWKQAALRKYYETRNDKFIRTRMCMEKNSVRETLGYVKCWGSIHLQEYKNLRMLKTSEIHEQVWIWKPTGIREPLGYVKWQRYMN
jgi:hypothetical protein